MKKLSLILILLILSSCAGSGRQQTNLEVKKDPLVYFNNEATKKKSGSSASDSSYLDKIRTKISQNWLPPQDSKGEKARLVFSVNRLGEVMDVKLIEDYSSGSFEFKKAAIRAIRSSDPFPPLPDEFPKNSLTLTVDLIPE